VINITALSLLKITRVRPCSICFDYDNKHYLIHGSYEMGEGSWQELYERKLDTNGKYNLLRLKTVDGDDDVKQDYIKRQRGKTIVYRNVDKAYFSYKLTKRGFATGVMESVVKEEQKHINRVEKQIKKHEEIIRHLRCEIAELR
jgi:hypothetical protein